MVGNMGLTDEMRGLMWQAIADVRDAALRRPDDAATDDILDALEPLLAQAFSLEGPCRKSADREGPPSACESICQTCGGANPVWFADHDLWNSVMGSEAGILCPLCFIKRAASAGNAPRVWRVCGQIEEEG